MLMLEILPLVPLTNEAAGLGLPPALAFSGTAVENGEWPSACS